MAIVTHRKKWRRWCGPMEELIRAAEYAVSVVERWSDGAEVKPRVEIVLKGDRIISSDTLEDLRNLHPRDYARAQSISVHGEVVGAPGEGISILARSEPPAVVAEVSGFHAQDTGGVEDVEGTLAQLTQVLNRGKTLQPVSGRDLFPLTLLVGTGIALAAAVDAVQQSGIRPLWAVLLIIGSVIGPVASGLLLAWTFPIFELIGPGESVKARRFGNWTFATVTAIAAAVIGTLIYVYAFERGTSKKALMVTNGAAALEPVASPANKNPAERGFRQAAGQGLEP
jgi:hypothetical protein